MAWCLSTNPCVSSCHGLMDRYIYTGKLMIDKTSPNKLSLIHSQHRLGPIIRPDVTELPKLLALSDIDSHLIESHCDVKAVTRVSFTQSSGYQVTFLLSPNTPNDWPWRTKMFVFFEFKVWFRWLSGKLWYLQHISVGDTIVFHLANDSFHTVIIGMFYAKSVYAIEY